MLNWLVLDCHLGCRGFQTGLHCYLIVLNIRLDGNVFIVDVWLDSYVIVFYGWLDAIIDDFRLDLILLILLIDLTQLVALAAHGHVFTHSFIAD
jgi:hypothetical protein